MNSPPVFIDLSMDEQVQELRIYFKNLGAEISPEKSTKGVEDDLHKIIAVCDVCFKDGEPQQIDCILNSIVSIMITIPIERVENIVLAYCEKMTKAPNVPLTKVCLQSLWRLFNNLDTASTLRYHVYYHLVQVAKQCDQVLEVFTGVDQLKAQFANCPPSAEQMQKLYRLLHDVTMATNLELSAKVMIELLGTYTADNALVAREDALKCIVTALADPNTFLLDPLLALKPVRFLEGDRFHDLLSIFVSEKLPSYIKFYEGHKELINSSLNHDQNMKKMRLLTFMQLAESNPEMTFETLTKELQISEDEVEAFVIEVLKTKLVRARLDQANRKVHISSTMHRTFGAHQWEQLRDLLHAWKDNLSVIREGLAQVSSVQLDLARSQKLMH
ncbi:eukaryotic translation initiation factor 3 subunit m [Cochliomyia hominivorax]